MCTSICGPNAWDFPESPDFQRISRQLFQITFRADSNEKNVPNSMSRCRVHNWTYGQKTFSENSQDFQFLPYMGTVLFYITFCADLEYENLVCICRDLFMSTIAQTLVVWKLGNLAFAWPENTVFFGESTEFTPSV